MPAGAEHMSRVYVAPVSFGLGDLVVSLPAVHALIARGDDTWLVSRSPAQAALAERIEGLGGCVPDEECDRDRASDRARDRASDRASDRFVDLRDHPLQRDHWWGSAAFEEAFGAIGINEIVARIGADFAIEVDISAPVPLIARPRPELQSTVLLVVESDGASKRWPVERWGALAGRLTERGLDVGVVTRHAATVDLGATRLPGVPAPTPGDAVDVLASARAVVGIDTGLTHVAAQQRTPTVTICRERAVFFRPWPHTRAVIGDPCDEACTAAEDRRAYNDRVDLRGLDWRPPLCPVDARCLDGVGPDAVLAALEQLL
jgi:Glycosyltransferase family 9 (heptosyltransferase)